MKDVQLVALLEAKQIHFKEVLAFIERNYSYSPSGFKNGNLYNTESENQGSARVLYLAFLKGLTKEDTLVLFGEHYSSVLSNPEGVDHQNIRQFLQHGWPGVSFEKVVLFELK